MLLDPPSNVITLKRHDQRHLTHYLWFASANFPPNISLIGMVWGDFLVSLKFSYCYKNSVRLQSPIWDQSTTMSILSN